MSNERPEGPQDILQPGEVLGGCVIESFIARGGMGDVYKARKVNLNCDVAIKVLQPCLVSREMIRCRFFREAKVAASLTHPSIVKVFDVGQQQDLYFIVMEFVEGRDLRNIVKKEGPLSADAALRLARQIAEALDYAHSQGVIHRDVKPANILLTADGTAKLADMGLARPVCQDTEVTVPGEVLGTPVFMSPEQYRGHPVDGRSDLYSLGATLYMVLSGKPPFQGESTAQLLHKVLNERPPSLQAQVAGLPEKVVGLVQRLMAKHPSARFQTGKEVAGAIQESLRRRVVFASEAKAASHSPRKEPVSLLRWAALIVLGIGLGIYTYFALPTTETLAESHSEHERSTRKPRRPSGGGVTLLHGVPDEGEDKTRPAARPTSKEKIADPSLRRRVDGLRDALQSGETSRLFSFFHPSQRDDEGLLISLAQVLESLKSGDLQPGVYVVRESSRNSAKLFLLYRNTSTGKSAGLRLNWTHTDGEWYVQPQLHSAEE